MVSSDFGKLEVRRHLISGADWAIAGAATSVVAPSVSGYAVVPAGTPLTITASLRTFNS